MGFSIKNKKIIATENIYREELDFKKNHYNFSVFKYSVIANRQPPVSANLPNKKPWLSQLKNK